LDQLREAWKAAAAGGFLTRDYRGGDGEVTTFQDFLYHRRAQLDPKRGDDGGPDGAGSAAARELAGQ
jgi:hypothetical protein